MRTAAIMQPTYLPWMGYFDLMDQCDVFVVLDSVQFDRHSWQQRNRVKTAHGPRWLTVPVLSRGRREQLISAVEIDPGGDFPRAHLKTIAHAYAKAPSYGRYAGSLAKILGGGHHYLGRLNAELIRWIAGELGITTELVRSSELDVQGRKVDLLVNICRQVGADRYLAPPGSRSYIEQHNLFRQHGIALEYHAYSPPRYPQLHGEFVPSLSVIDVMFNVGERSLEVVRSGRLATTP
jgi:hypothetical protein